MYLCGKFTDMSIFYNTMVRTSRFCGLTVKLHKVLDEKLTEAEKRDFAQWLQIVEQERQLEVNKVKRSFPKL